MLNARSCFMSKTHRASCDSNLITFFLLEVDQTKHMFPPKFPFNNLAQFSTQLNHVIMPPVGTKQKVFQAFKKTVGYNENW